MDTLPASWGARFSDDVTCDDNEGEWIVQAILSSRGPYPFFEGGKVKGYLRAWAGEIRSEEIHLQFEQPSGVDALAYKAFAGAPLSDSARLLREFPASTYAGYILLGGAPWDLDPVAEIRVRGNDLESAKRNPAILPQMQRREDEKRKRAEDRVRALQAYLDLRPDFAFSDFLRLDVATRLAYLENYTQAMAICQKIGDRPETKGIRQKAVILADFMKQQGWVKR